MQTKFNYLASKVAAQNPLAARMQLLNARAGRRYGVAVKQGRFIGCETIGRKTSYVTKWFDSHAECVAALEAVA
jgi:hypothetical protein